jgi:hypothetical protein
MQRVSNERTWGLATRAARCAESGWSDERAVTDMHPAQKRVSCCKTCADCSTSSRVGTRTSILVPLLALLPGDCCSSLFRT